jgi:hypothetical protein
MSHFWDVFFSEGVFLDVIVLAVCLVGVGACIIEWRSLNRK